MAQEVKKKDELGDGWTGYASQTKSGTEQMTPLLLWENVTTNLVVMVCIVVGTSPELFFMRAWPPRPSPFMPVRPSDYSRWSQVSAKGSDVLFTCRRARFSHHR